MKALSDIPTPNRDAKTIVGFIKHSGKVTGYQLSGGRSVGKEEGVLLAKQGEIQDVDSFAKSLSVFQENSSF